MKTYQQPITSMVAVCTHIMIAIGVSGNEQWKARVPERIRGLKYL